MRKQFVLDKRSDKLLEELASVRDLFLGLPEADRNKIIEHLKYLKRFPHLYPVRTKGRLRRHRWFQAGNWLVYYRFAGGVVYIRGLWPARIP